MPEHIGGPPVPRDDLEHEHLDELEAEVARTEFDLVDAEVEAETLRVELANFAYAHHRRLGRFYRHLDLLDVLIAEVIAVQTGDPADAERAREARAQLDEPDPAHEEPPRTHDGTDGGTHADPAEDTGDDDFKVAPTAEARRLYRGLARRAHPDLTQDTKEKKRREDLIRRANDAYARGDVAVLAQLSEEWAAGPDSAPPPGSPQRPAWLRTRLSWLRKRLEEVSAERTSLEQSPIGELLCLDPEGPDQVLDRLAVSLFTQIAEREDSLRRLGVAVDSVGGHLG
ncbi:MAG: hypothetical protein ACRDPK_13000 [Carbonactinosporaceae bacterium]